MSFNNLTAKTMISRSLLRLFFICVTIMMLYPLIWNLYSSFKTNTEFLENAFALPGGLEWSNYHRALIKSHLLNNILNSVYTVIISLAVICAFTIPCSYCLVRFKFFGSRFMMGVYISAIFIQATYIMIPLFLQINSLGLLNNLPTLGVLYAVMQFPFSIFLLSGYIRGIPRDFEEAAMIDGCGYPGILRHVVFPMARPGIVTVCMLSAMAAWNEYAVALVMITDPEKQTLPVGLANLFEVQRYATDWGALFAALILVLLPTLVLFIIGQKQLVNGIALGGLKG